MREEQIERLVQKELNKVLGPYHEYYDSDPHDQAVENSQQQQTEAEDIDSPAPTPSTSATCFALFGYHTHFDSSLLNYLSKKYLFYKMEPISSPEEIQTLFSDPKCILGLQDKQAQYSAEDCLLRADRFPCMVEEAVKLKMRIQQLEDQVEDLKIQLEDAQTVQQQEEVVENEYKPVEQNETIYSSAHHKGKHSKTKRR